MERKPEQISRDIAAFERKLSEAGDNQVLKEALTKRIKKLKDELKGGSQSTKQLAYTLLGARKKVKELAAKDFRALMLRLSKKSEYDFLKRYSAAKAKDDMERKAKPVGYRFKGRGNYDTPTKREIAKGLANKTVYYERRPRRSDVSQVIQLAKGGGVGNKKIVTIENLEVCNLESGPVIYDKAVKMISKLGDGWRLPTRKEFKTILEKNKDKIPNKREVQYGYVWYWSGTTSKFDYNYIYNFEVGEGNRGNTFNFKNSENSDKLDVIAVREISSKSKMAKGGGVGDYKVVLEAGDFYQDSFQKYLKTNNICSKIVKKLPYGMNQVEFTGSKVALEKMIKKHFAIDIEKEDEMEMYNSIKKMATGGGVEEEYLSKKRGELNSYSDEKIAKIYSELKNIDYSDMIIELKGNRAERQDAINYILKEAAKKGNPNKMATGGGVEEYPELRKIADEIADETAEKINKRVEKINSKMPYKAQWVLEEVVRDLENRI